MIAGVTAEWKLLKLSRILMARHYMHPLMSSVQFILYLISSLGQMLYLPLSLCPFVYIRLSICLWIYLNLFLSPSENGLGNNASKHSFYRQLCASDQSLHKRKIRYLDPQHLIVSTQLFLNPRYAILNYAPSQTVITNSYTFLFGATCVLTKISALDTSFYGCKHGCSFYCQAVEAIVLKRHQPYFCSVCVALFLSSHTNCSPRASANYAQLTSRFSGYRNNAKMSDNCW